MTKLAIITGGNKGIGFEIAKNIAASGDIKCIIAARTLETAEHALHTIRGAGGQAEFKRLDLSLPDSINFFVEDIRQEYNAVDILVNNAGIFFGVDDPTPFAVQVEKLLQTNFWGTAHLTHALLPMLRQASGGARIVFMASGMGHLNIIPDENKKLFISRPDLTKEELFTFINEFRSDVEEGRHQERGWPNRAYGMSKLGVIAYSNIIAREEAKNGMIVNACSPGYTSTEMTKFNKGGKTVSDGARTPTMLALSPDITSSGGFWEDEQLQQW